MDGILLYTIHQQETKPLIDTRQFREMARENKFEIKDYSFLIEDSTITFKQVLKISNQ